MFESEHNCKVRFSTNTKEIIVNWNPERFRAFQPEYNALLIKSSSKKTQKVYPSIRKSKGDQKIPRVKRTIDKLLDEMIEKNDKEITEKFFKD